MFKRQLRLLLNKCSANNFEIIIAEFKQIAASAPNNGVVYFGSQLFDKVCKLSLFGSADQIERALTSQSITEQNW